MLNESEIHNLGTSGICISCSYSVCPMREMLRTHYSFLKIFGDYRDSDPGLWEGTATEDPEFNDSGEVTWCPQYWAYGV